MVLTIRTVSLGSALQELCATTALGATVLSSHIKMKLSWYSQFHSSSIQCGAASSLESHLGVKKMAASSA
jgi:hypothetical protein